MALLFSDVQPEPGCGRTARISENDPSKATSVIFLSQPKTQWHRTSKKDLKKIRNLVRNNPKGKSYEIKTQRTSRGSALEIPY